jgi:1-deoxy-D-xylulose-5-phosphate reductoisomerase
MSGNRRRITVLGSTGSVGVNTLDLVDFARKRGEAEVAVEALTANSNVALLAEQARKFRPRFVAIGDASKREALKSALSGEGIEIGAGPEAIEEAGARDADWVMAAIVGAAGLKPTLNAAKRGAAIALANKECLVCAGDVVMDAIRKSGGVLLPVDSEHNAIFQVFDFERPQRVSRLILTASGGPFRTWSKAEMATATPQQAVAHPNWSMGAKISVDSATMMNKGLELIEASHIFPVPHEKIEILVHPQSVIHSMVEYVDGSVLAQLGSPDMRIPIAYALAYPERIPTPAQRLDLARIGSLTFEAPDVERFPALRLARQALEDGGAAPIVLNAANEEAVAAFLARRIGFLDICQTVEEALHRTGAEQPRSIADVIDIDREARALARELMSELAA